MPIMLFHPVEHILAGILALCPDDRREVLGFAIAMLPAVSALTTMVESVSILMVLVALIALPDIGGLVLVRDNPLTIEPPTHQEYLSTFLSPRRARIRNRIAIC
jgi:hypothetical protein